jgi:Golgi phosphoprotein 3 (GPP34)
MQQQAPDARSAALIALLHALRCEHQIFDPRPYGLSKRQLRAQAEEIAKSSWASEAIRKAITEIIAPVAATTAAVAATGGANIASVPLPESDRHQLAWMDSPGYEASEPNRNPRPRKNLCWSASYGLRLLPAPHGPRPLSPAREPLLPIRRLCPHRLFRRAAAPGRCMRWWPAPSRPLWQPPHRFRRRTTAVRR